MDELAIRVEDVSKVYRLYNRPSERLFDALGLAGKGRFKEHRALDHVTFDVKKGETVGIIGTNGSGKSTILKIITGVLSPTSGEVEILPSRSTEESRRCWNLAQALTWNTPASKTYISTA